MRPPGRASPSQSASNVPTTCCQATRERLRRRAVDVHRRRRARTTARHDTLPGAADPPAQPRCFVVIGRSRGLPVWSLRRTAAGRRPTVAIWWNWTEAVEVGAEPRPHPGQPWWRGGGGTPTTTRGLPDDDRRHRAGDDHHLHPLPGRDRRRHAGSEHQRGHGPRLARPAEAQPMPRVEPSLSPSQPCPATRLRRPTVVSSSRIRSPWSVPRRVRRRQSSGRSHCSPWSTSRCMRRVATWGAPTAVFAGPGLLA